jgi:hypothetical protein
MVHHDYASWIAGAITALPLKLASLRRWHTPCQAQLHPGPDYTTAPRRAKNQSLTRYLNSIQGKYTYLVTYDCNQTSPWEELDVDDGIMKPGFGYWIYMTQAGSIPAPVK